MKVGAENVRKNGNISDEIGVGTSGFQERENGGVDSYVRGVI